MLSLFVFVSCVFPVITISLLSLNYLITEGTLTAVVKQCIVFFLFIPDITQNENRLAYVSHSLVLL